MSRKSKISTLEYNKLSSHGPQIPCETLLFLSNDWPTTFNLSSFLSVFSHLLPHFVENSTLPTPKLKCLVSNDSFSWQFYRLAYFFEIYSFPTFQVCCHLLSIFSLLVRRKHIPVVLGNSLSFFRIRGQVTKNHAK